jgi:hypothetical protein
MTLRSTTAGGLQSQKGAAFCYFFLYGIYMREHTTSQVYTIGYQYGIMPKL